MPGPPLPNRRLGPSKRRIPLPVALGAVAVTVIGALGVLALPAAAQQPPDQVPTTGFSVWVDAAIGAVVTLLVGGGLVAIAPEFTERTTDRVLEEPGETFLYGLGIFVAAIVVVFLLAITVVGILLVIPLLIALVIIGELGYLAAGRAVVDDWGPALLVAVAVSAFASGVPLLGGLVGFVLACLGTGAWYLDYRDDGSSSGGGSDFDPSYSGTSGPSTTGGEVTDEWGTERTAGDADATRGPGADADGPDGATDVDGDSGTDDAGADGDPDDEWTAGFDAEDRE